MATGTACYPRAEIRHCSKLPLTNSSGSYEKVKGPGPTAQPNSKKIHAPNRPETNPLPTPFARERLDLLAFAAASSPQQRSAVIGTLSASDSVEARSSLVRHPNRLVSLAPTGLHLQPRRRRPPVSRQRQSASLLTHRHSNRS
ncbi:hypothetical protein S83_050318 [Arachis hypogaea]